MTLALRNISHVFGDFKAVDDASLEAKAGEIVVLYGHSGCGKTTLLRIASGLEPLQTGTIEVSGRVVAAEGHHTPPEKRPVGFVFQDYALFPHLSVEQNISFGIVGAPDCQAQVAAQIKALGLEGLAGRYPHELSGGQQQRVALARALVRRPQALLLDEPFASIDTTLRRTLREGLRRILKEQNVVVILVTHDPEEALSLGDRVALMRAGKIIETATPKGLFEAPGTPEGAGIFPGCQSLAGAISGGMLTTPAGEFPARGLADGEGVAILRDGALSAFSDSSGAFCVTDIRFKGPDWSVRLEGRQDAVGLWVAMADRPEMGAVMTLAADLQKTFVYSKQ